MTSRHRIRTAAALGLCAPLLAGAAFGGATLASADSAPRPEATSAVQLPAHTDAANAGAPDVDASATGAVEMDAVDTDVAGTDAQNAEEPIDLVTTGALTFAHPADSAVSSEAVAEQLHSAVANSDRSDPTTCSEGLDLEDPDGVATCTVTGWSGQEETYYAYISPAAVTEEDFRLYFAKDAPLSEAAAQAVNDGVNGTGVYPAFGEEDRAQDVLDPHLAVDRANFVLDGIGREDMTVVSVDDQVDLRVPEPVRGTAVESGSGRTVGVTLLPVPTEGETPGLLVSIDGP